MKRVILAIQVLLFTALQAAAYEVTVEDRVIEVPVTESETIYTIGNGRNASIPQYVTGTLTIPSISNNVGDKNVVGKFAFRFCAGITKIIIEEGINAIEDYAFVGCSGVTSIELPSTLTSVGRGAFVGLPNLQKIICKAATAPEWVSADVFSYEGTAESMAEDAQTRILYVPFGSGDSYRSCKYESRVGWADAFKRIYEINDDPQEITSLQDLKDFRDAVNSGGYYKSSSNRMVTLTTDIDLSELSELSWEPIGTEEHPFNGVFDGGGHTIKNLFVTGNNIYQGLFGRATNATIYNLHLLNPKVIGKDYIGSLVGYVDGNSHITDVLVVGGSETKTVNAWDGSGGGIVGYAANAAIERCMFRGQVECWGWTGGIVGKVLNNVIITDCSASCFLQNLDDTETASNKPIGGIVGGAGSVNIERCFAKNSFGKSNDAATLYIGKIVGLTNGSEAGTIQNCAYWQFDESPVLGHHDVGTPTETGNVMYAKESFMNQEQTKAVLGTENWYYFTGNYKDYPVPVTLKDMYLSNYVDKVDGDFVYRPAGEGEETSYEIVKYTGSSTPVVIPDTYNAKPVTAILAEVFKDNKTMESVTIGSNITSIGASAFENCDALTSVSLPDAVTTVGKGAFIGCDELASFHIGKGFETHTGNFLADCPNLSTITVAPGNVSDYRSVDNVLIHNVGAYGSYGSFVVVCAPGKTGDYTIPTSELGNESVWIMDNCFASCYGLTSITFPAGKNYKLDAGIFDDAYNLRYVDMRNVNNFINNDKEVITVNVDRSNPESPFYGMSENTVIYLPYGNKAEDYEPNVLIMNGDKNAATANFVFLEDGYDFNPQVPVTATNGVRYERYISYTSQKEDESYSAQGITVFLPYDFTLSNENAGVYAPSTIEEVAGTTTVTFTEVADKKMAAYTPYYIVMKEDQEIDFSVSGETVIATPPTSDPAAISGFMLKGTTVTIPNSSLYDALKPAYLLQSDGKWHKVPNNQPMAYIGPFRAYFQAAGTSAAHTLNMVIEGDGEATGIQQIRTIDADGTERYFDLNGKLLPGKPQKGLYIHNGKKYMHQ